jgi:hypothetical protein
VDVQTRVDRRGFDAEFGGQAEVCAAERVHVHGEDVTEGGFQDQEDDKWIAIRVYAQAPQCSTPGDKSARWVPTSTQRACVDPNIKSINIVSL